MAGEGRHGVAYKIALNTLMDSYTICDVQTLVGDIVFCSFALLFVGSPSCAFYGGVACKVWGS